MRFVQLNAPCRFREPPEELQWRQCHSWDVFCLRASIFEALVARAILRNTRATNNCLCSLLNAGGARRRARNRARRHASSLRAIPPAHRGAAATRLSSLASTHLVNFRPWGNFSVRLALLSSLLGEGCLVLRVRLPLAVSVPAFLSVFLLYRGLSLTIAAPAHPKLSSNMRPLLRTLRVLTRSTDRPRRPNWTAIAHRRQSSSPSSLRYRRSMRTARNCGMPANTSASNLLGPPAWPGFWTGRRGVHSMSIGSVIASVRPC
jgi:hypothetical protein